MFVNKKNLKNKKALTVGILFIGLVMLIGVSGVLDNNLKAGDTHFEVANSKAEAESKVAKENGRGSVADINSDFQAHFVKGTSVILKNNDKYYYNQGYYTTHNKDGKVVYCLNPYVLADKVKAELDINDGEVFQKLGKTKRLEIEKYVRVANKLYADSKDEKYLLAGQVEIWKAVGVEVAEVSQDLDKYLAKVEEESAKAVVEDSEYKYLDTNGQDLVEDINAGLDNIKSEVTISYPNTIVNDITTSKVKGEVKLSTIRNFSKMSLIIENDKLESKTKVFNEDELAKLNKGEAVAFAFNELSSNSKYRVYMRGEENGVAKELKINNEDVYSIETDKVLPKLTVTDVVSGVTDITFKVNVDDGDDALTSAIDVQVIDEKGKVVKEEKISGSSEIHEEGLVGNTNYEIVVSGEANVQPKYEIEGREINANGTIKTQEEVVKEFDFLETLDAKEDIGVDNVAFTMQLTNNDILKDTDVKTITLEVRDAGNGKVVQKIDLSNKINELLNGDVVNVNVDKLNAGTKYSEEIAITNAQGTVQVSKINEHDNVSVTTDKVVPLVKIEDVKVIDNGVKLKLNVEDKLNALMGNVEVGLFVKEGTDYVEVGRNKVAENNKDIEVDFINGNDYGLGAIDVKAGAEIEIKVMGEYDIDPTVDAGDDNQVIDDVLKDENNNLLDDYTKLPSSSETLAMRVKVDNLSEDVTKDEATIKLQARPKRRFFHIDRTLINDVNKVSVKLVSEGVVKDEYSLDAREVESLKDLNEVEIKFGGLTANTDYQIEVGVEYSNGDKEDSELVTENLNKGVVNNIYTDYNEPEIKLATKEIGIRNVTFVSEIVDDNNILNTKKIRLIDSSGKEVEEDITNKVVEVNGLKSNTTYQVEGVGTYSVDNKYYHLNNDKEEVIGEGEVVKTAKGLKEPTAKIDADKTYYDLENKNLTIAYSISDPQKTILNNEVTVKVEDKKGNVVYEEKQAANNPQEIVLENKLEGGEEYQIKIEGAYDIDLDNKNDNEDNQALNKEYKVNVLSTTDGGDGYALDTCQQLLSIGKVNDGVFYSDELQYQLSEDIDCGSEKIENSVIETNKGTIDGNNKTLSNLEISGDATTVGLVGTNSGVIQNMKIENPHVVGNDNVGTIAGINTGTIENITLEINGEMSKGSKDTKSEESGTDTDSVGDCQKEQYCMLEGNTYAGGIVGINSATIKDTLIENKQLNDTESEALIKGLDRGTGGIVGSNTTTGYVENVEVRNMVVSANNNTALAVGKNAGEINNTRVENGYMEALGDDNGGIVGENRGTIANSTLTNATVEGVSEIGGIAGVNHSLVQNSKVINSNIQGMPSSREARFGSEDYFIGGIVGSNFYGTVENNEFSGSVSSSSEKGTGGIVGNALGDNVSDNRLTGKVKISGKNNVGGIAGLGKINNTQPLEINNLEVVGTGDGVGGVVGNGNIKNSSSITVGSNSSVTGEGNYTGGIAGEIDNSGSKTTLSNVKNSAMVMGEDYTGGIAGLSNNIEINHGENTGKIIGNNYTGGIIGKIFNQKNRRMISNVNNSGDIKGENYTGGIVGRSFYAHFYNTENTGEITGNYSTGGIVGEVGEDDGIEASSPYQSTIIEESKNSGNIKGGDYTGGILGYGAGDIISPGNSGDVIGRDNVGGIVGKNYKEFKTTEILIEFSSPVIGNVINGKESGNVSGNNKVGGIVGSSLGSVKQTEVVGNIKGEKYVGGIIGQGNQVLAIEDLIESNILKIKGNVMGEQYVGGIAGENDGILNNISVSEESTISGKSHVGSVTGVNKGNIEHTFSSGAIIDTSTNKSEDFIGMINGGQVDQAWTRRTIYNGEFYPKSVNVFSGVSADVIEDEVSANKCVQQHYEINKNMTKAEYKELVSKKSQNFDENGVPEYCGHEELTNEDRRRSYIALDDDNGYEVTQKELDVKNYYRDLPINGKMDFDNQAASLKTNNSSGKSLPPLPPFIADEIPYGVSLTIWLIEEGYGYWYVEKPTVGNYAYPQVEENIKMDLENGTIYNFDMEKIWNKNVYPPQLKYFESKGE